jgi:hypothetical protein
LIFFAFSLFSNLLNINVAKNAEMGKYATRGTNWAHGFGLDSSSNTLSEKEEVYDTLNETGE